MDAWVTKAYDNWTQVVEYDGKSLLNFKHNKKSGIPQNDLPTGPVNYPNSVDNQLPPRRLPVSIPSELSGDQNILIAGIAILL